MQSERPYILAYMSYTRHRLILMRIYGLLRGIKIGRSERGKRSLEGLIEVRKGLALARRPNRNAILSYELGLAARNIDVLARDR